MSLAATTSGTPSATSTVDFIRLLEADDSPIHWLQVLTKGGAVKIDNGLKAVRFIDPNQWEQIGRVLGRSTKLRTLYLISPIDVHTLPAESYQSLTAFYDGLKYNTSVQHMKLHFNSSDFSNFFDWEYFMTNNKQMKRLSTSSTITPLLPEEGRIIELAVQNSSSLKSLDIHSSRLRDDGVLEQILLSCSTIRSLHLECDEVYKCAAVAEFLQNQTTQLQYLRVYKVAQGGLGIIAESLANNTCLKNLVSDGSVNRKNRGTFARILCDETSLTSIETSNHTLVEIPAYLDSKRNHILDCLELNKNDNKEQVARQKIAKYYFAGNFDMSPFASMPVSVIPNVMEMIGGDNPIGNDDRDTKQSLQCNAIFRMLKAIPDLLNTSNREAEELEDAGEN